MKSSYFAALLLVLSLCTVSATELPSRSADSFHPPLPDSATLRRWVAEMKEAPRGPFQHIRWFCKDGSVQLPEEYACRDRGGGVQHGEWTDRVKRLRASGYYLATVFADIQPDLFVTDPLYPEMIRQMILEQFLITADDGWILRRARYYRGALQAEDETARGRELLEALAAQPRMIGRDFVVLREAVRLFPHGRAGTPISEMRQLSRTLAEKDNRFETLRVKIHVKPQPADAAAVRAYASEKGLPELSTQYEQLARHIEAVFEYRDVSTDVAALAGKVKHVELARLMRQRIGQLRDENEPWVRFAAGARLLATLREYLSEIPSPALRMRILDLGLALEADLFQNANALLAGLARADRQARILWLRAAATAVYGSGLLTRRQWSELKNSFDSLNRPAVVLINYKNELNFASRVPTWADRNMRFHFSEAVDAYTDLELRSRAYLHDRLRGSLLLFYASVLDSLMIDVSRQLGIQNHILGQPVAAGMTALNPGLARGVIRVFRPGDRVSDFDPKGIYLLPATFEDLPPVAGIITAGEGNMLSHVQLLARNLGIPNVAVDQSLLPRFETLEGRKVVLAVSPKGVVQVAADAPEWEAILAQKDSSPQLTRIRPDMAKLDLASRSLIRLSDLRASASGKVCGPKAANLGELKHFFPEAVAEGLVIPFGVFRALLDQPFEPGGPSVFEWMQAQYRRIDQLDSRPREQDQAVRDYLAAIRRWLDTADPGPEFRNRLRKTLAETFGPDGSFGVFVRSDTNVEDLPGFTGAGLNKTVPHVVGFENIFKAIREVWASPFSERAYRWRQSFMETPEHVYASVLLMMSVPAEKSGVMVTADVDSGASDWLSIAVNEGVGGAVSGQTAEELRYHLTSGRLRLLAHATEPRKRVLLATGGIAHVAASGSEAVLSPQEIDQLVAFARSVPQRFPGMTNIRGEAVPADIEFGFYRQQLALFQIRPFLESSRARRNLYLNQLDQSLKERFQRTVDMQQIPEEKMK
jgi:hypothetical protein